MKKKFFHTLFSIILWLLIWHTASLIIGNSVFLPSPLYTLKSLVSLFRVPEFYKSTGNTLKRIAAGFAIGISSGILLTAASSLHPLAEAVISLPVKIIRCVPVASVVILSLLWFKSSGLSIFISAIMVMPVIYTGLMEAVHGTDPKLLEMARIYRMPFFKKVLYIYLPSLAPALISSISISAGFAWKSGVAAEIIGLVRNTIGNSLYISKMYLETGDMFAWTLVTILLSICFEKLITFTVKFLLKKTGALYYETTDTDTKSHNKI